MNLTQALDEFELLQRRRSPGPEGQLQALALASLREFLVDYSGFEDTQEIRPADLVNFLLDYYPSEEEPDRTVALALLEASAGFARWLVEREERGLAPFITAEFTLRDDLPRVLEAYALLKEHAGRDDLTVPADITDDEGEQVLGEVATQYQRIARLDQVDYTAAEQDHYVVARVDEGAVTLRSQAREVLGEGEASPVLLPPAATKLLRPDDRIHAEIAPGSAGWELLDVFGVRPGGYP